MTQLTEIKRFTSLNHNEEYSINEKTFVISSVKLHRDGFNQYSGTIDGEPFENLDSPQLKKMLGVSTLPMNSGSVEITDEYIDAKCGEVVERMTSKVKSMESLFSSEFIDKVLLMAHDEILNKSLALREELTAKMEKQQAVKSEQAMKDRCNALGVRIGQVRTMAKAMGVEVEQILSNMEQLKQ